jgi:hypothetical protein
MPGERLIRIGLRRGAAWHAAVLHVHAALRSVLPIPALAAPVAIDAPRVAPAGRGERAVPRVRQMLRLLFRRWDTEAWVALMASAASVASYVYYAQQGLTLAYDDAISHMMIAHRVFSSSTPGLAQLGTVWLPLNHILMLPLIWNDALFRDGFAGTCPSMVAYVVSAVYMYRLGGLVFSSRVAGWAAALTLMLNPSVLYMQSTPMSELDLICFAVVAIFYAIRWARSFDANDLVKCALATAAGTLVRYDGWALALALLFVVGVVAWRLRGRLIAESHGLLFGTLGLAGCVAWVTYQAVIFKNPFDFLNGPYSAQVQQQVIQRGAGLPTHHNALLSLNVYTDTTLDTLTWPIAVAALLGLCCWIFRTRLHVATWPIYAVLIPFAFNWLSLVLGMTVIQTPEVPFYGIATFFNVRYGLMMIPAAALFVAALTTLRRELAPIVFGLVILASTPIVAGATPYVLQDPLHETGRALTVEGGQWLASHYHGGAVLASSSTLSGLMFDSGLPDRAFLSDGDGASFRAALAHPETAVAWIAMSPDSGNFDPVWIALHNRSDWRQYFVLRQVFGNTQIYERKNVTNALAPPPVTLPIATLSNPYNPPRLAFTQMFLQSSAKGV